MVLGFDYRYEPVKEGLRRIICSDGGAQGHAKSAGDFWHPRLPGVPPLLLALFFSGSRRTRIHVKFCAKQSRSKMN